MGELKPCRACGHKVHLAAKSCPSCGVPHPANPVAAAGSAMTQAGCALTMLVPLLIVMLVGLMMMCEGILG